LCSFYLAAIIAVVPLLFSSSPAAPSPGETVIALVKSKDNVQYENAVRGFVKSLKERHIALDLKIYGPEDKNIIQGIKSQKPVLILTLGTTATKFVSREVTDIPIVFSMILDPRGSSVTSANIAGVSLDIPARLQLETLKSVVPTFKRICVIYNPPENGAITRQAKKAGKGLGLILNLYPVNSEKEIPKIEDLNIDLLWIIPDTVVCKPVIIKRILLSCLKKNVAVMGFTHYYARGGALLAVACDYEDIGRQSAEMVVKLLNGEDYSSLKITVPRKVKLYLNKITADRLGIKIPDRIIQKASEVFGQ
jgi:putative ABC transport system substrate-binding protein